METCTVPFRAASWKRGFRGLSWFLTRCKLSYMQKGRKNSVSLWARVEGCPLDGPKEAGAGLCVCVSLILAAVFLSHTVGPTSCFHCPSLLPRERREEGERDGSVTELIVHFHHRPDLGDLLSLSLAVETCCFPLIACLYLFSDDPWFQPVVNHEN